MYGLSEKIYRMIKEISNKYNYKFILFGSRAKEKYKPNSDIDIAVFGNVTEKEKFLIRNDIDKLDIPYTIDLLFMNENLGKNIINSILNEGVEI